MTREKAIEWLRLQRDKKILWDDYSDNTQNIRKEAEKQIKESYEMAIKALEQEPKTGRWITKSHGFPPEPTSVCSECGFDRDFYIRISGFDKIKYCPNCGAKMEEVEE